MTLNHSMDNIDTNDNQLILNVFKSDETQTKRKVIKKVNKKQINKKSEIIDKSVNKHQKDNRFGQKSSPEDGREEEPRFRPPNRADRHRKPERGERRQGSANPVNSRLFDASSDNFPAISL